MKKEQKINQKIRIFCLVEGKIIDKLPDRISGTYIRIHNILNELRKFDDIELISIPYKYNLEGDRFKDNWFERRKNFIYSWIVPVMSFLMVLVIRPHYLYFSYPQAVGVNSLHTNKLNLFIIKFCKKFKIRTIMYAHDWNDQGRIVGTGSNIFLTDDLEKYLVSNSDILLCVVSKYPQFETLQLVGGFDKKEFSNFKYKVCPKRFHIGYIGGISKGRGIELVIDSSIQLNKKYPFVKLYLFGPLVNLDRNYVEFINKKSFITQKLIPRTELVKHFTDIDVWIYPYSPKIEYSNGGVSTKFFEYIGSEIPIISTKTKGVTSLIGCNGIMFFNFSINDLTDKLEFLLINHDVRQKLHMDLKKMKINHTWAKRAEIFHNLIIKDFNCHFDLNKN